MTILRSWTCIFFFAAYLSFGSVCDAATFRLDFAGTLSHIASSAAGNYSDTAPLPSPVEFSGYLTFDLTIPISSQDETGAAYFNMTVNGGLTLGSNNYLLDTSDAYDSSTIVLNGADVGGHVFGSYNQFVSDNGGDALIFGVLFQAEDMDWLDGFNIPNSFSLEDVDPFNVDSVFSTQGLNFTSDGFETVFEYGAFTSAEFRPVPVPGAIVLMMSALGLTGFWRRRIDGTLDANQK